jgi:hypothetical protein
LDNGKCRAISASAIAYGQPAIATTVSGRKGCQTGIQVAGVQFTRTKYPPSSKLVSMSPWKARLTASLMRRGK